LEEDLWDRISLGPKKSKDLDSGEGEEKGMPKRNSNIGKSVDLNPKTKKPINNTRKAVQKKGAKVGPQGPTLNNEKHRPGPGGEPPFLCRKGKKSRF